MSTQSFLGLPPIPAELRPITSFIQRAAELKDQDPVIAYWCAYYAAQQGIALKASAPENRKFLSQLLSILESLRATIGPSEAVDVESVSSVYVEDFALRVFNVADNEDRSGKATRNTAKKFLAAATFLEVLKVFEDKQSWESHADKARYAKWKAADIAKAFREGRAPNPGPAGSSPAEPESASSEVSSPQNLPSPPSSTSSVPTMPSFATSSRPTHFDSTGGTVDRNVTDSGFWSTTSTAGAPGPRTTSAVAEDEGAYEAPPHPRTSSPPLVVASSLSPVGEEGATASGGPPSPPSSVSSSSAKKRRSRAGSLSLTTPPAVSPGGTGHARQRTSSVSSASSHSAHSARSLNRPSSPTHFIPRDIPPPTHSHQSIPSQPSSANSATSFPSYQPSPSFPHAGSSPYASAPPLPSNAGLVYPSAPPPPAPCQPSPPPELTPQVIAKAQKHCRFAISALDYEDAVQARKELRAALQLLGDF